MKRILVFVIVLAVLFSLCACGSPEAAGKEDKNDKPQEMVNETATENNEASQTEAAAPEQEASQSQEEEEANAPSIIEVEITKENFFDYYELIEVMPGGLIEKDSSGNITSDLTAGAFSLKKEYQKIPESKRNDCHVEIGVKYDQLSFSGEAEMSNIEVDFNNLTYTVTGKPGIINKEDQLLTARFDKQASYDYYYGTIDIGLILLTDFWCTVTDYESLELVSASGTIYLSGE